MPTIITKAAKGSELTHAEMDQNLVNLNEGIGTAQADAQLKLQAMTEAEFMARAAANRDRYAGSGFIEWGKHGNSGTLPLITPVNEGIWMRPSAAVANTFYLGSAHASAFGASKTPHPVVNINGFELEIASLDVSGLYSSIKLPPAPATADMLERQDLVFLEAWHEPITDKDFVYPRGNVQYGATVDPSTGLATVNGSFTGYGTYSLFGSWQNSGDLIGKGLVWSTLSEADKKKIVSDPKNNVYLAEDGTWVQVRYRIRVVEGLGAKWSVLNVDRASNIVPYACYDTSNRISPQGALVKPQVGVDLKNSSTGYNGAQYYIPNDSDAFSAGGIGCWSALTNMISPRDTDQDLGYKGLCFAVPICLVPRRNQGAYHWPLNTNGAAMWRNSGDTGGVLWFDTNIGGNPSSTADCFREYTDGFPYKTKGFISTALSGRPDGRFYDAIYESDILDLRTSAHKVTDLNRCREREFNRLDACEIRGWEKQFGISAIYDFHGEYVNTSDGYLSASMRAVAEIGDYVFNVTDGLWFYVYNAGATNIRPLIGRPPSTVYSSTATGGTRDWLLFKPKFSAASKTLLQCDIIGDPSNYPDEWFTNGFAGTPLLVGENGENYIDADMDTIKASRKATKHLLTIRSSDKGATWSTTSNTIDLTTNKFTVGGTSDYVTLVFYETESSPFETADNAERLIPGKVFMSGASKVTDGCNLVANLIGKVPTGTAEGDRGVTNLITYTEDENGMLVASVPPIHPAIVPSSTSTPVVKVEVSLTRENGKLFLQCLFKEMVHNGSSWGDDSKFDVVDGVSTTTDDNGNTVLIGQKRVELPYFIGDAE